ncbi:4-hydroxyphenylpyruvate dioxygenase [Paenibacillus oenotherae]|uniref:4-hydroxyphenylpyruvate dioxygenase n=1 Tax=Paenibacillus oenotherae TaxID=1435645 RepID=UPI001FE30AE0|nr:4-hydroxyphenylpyruvate dioxygenase [Paenibacillus oenotherae]
MSYHVQNRFEKASAVDVIDIEYIEMYTSNAKQSAFYFCKLYGFEIIGYSGLETGNREKTSYYLQQGDARLILSAAYSSNHFISDFVNKRGDGVKDIALLVDDVEETYRNALLNGGIAIEEPNTVKDEHGEIKRAVLGTFGETIHTLIEKHNYTGTMLPNFEAVKGKYITPKTGITRFDHLAICVEQNQEWIEYYESVFGFAMSQQFSKDQVSSQTSSLMTKILQNGTDKVKMTIIEPAQGKKKSQITEFLEYNAGAGVQHIALLTSNILETVDNLQMSGTEFLYTPDMYYDMLPDRVGNIDESIDKLHRLKILVDRDDEGYLLQIFARAIQDRPTLFFEIIQRKGSRGFGNGNIRALFEAVEREQALRGNL